MTYVTNITFNYFSNVNVVKPQSGVNFLNLYLQNIMYNVYTYIITYTVLLGLHAVWKPYTLYILTSILYNYIVLHAY